MEQISPELALVDAELARIARVLLRDPWDPVVIRRGLPAGAAPTMGGATAQRAVHVGAARHPAPLTRDQEREPGPRRGFLGLVLVAAVVAALAVAPRLANQPAEPRLAVNEPPSAPDVAATTPAETVPVRRPAQAVAPKAPVQTVAIAWPRAKSADLYNVILLRNGKRIDVWSKGTTLRLTTGTLPSARRVPAGTYRWFVYPGVRRAGEVRYGALRAHGTVRVRAR